MFGKISIYYYRILPNDDSRLNDLRIYIYIYRERERERERRVFANGPEDLGSIPGRVISKTLKMVLDTSLLNTQQYKVRIKDKVEQSRKRRSALLHPGVVAFEKGANWSSTTTVATLLIHTHTHTYTHTHTHIYIYIYTYTRCIR